MTFDIGTHLAGLSLYDTLLAVTLSVLLSLGSIGLITIVTRRVARAHTGSPDVAAPTTSVFLFDEQRLVSAPADWRDNLDTAGQDASDWDVLRRQLLPRFPDLPELPELGPDETFRSLKARCSDDHGVLRIRQIGRRLRLTLRESEAGSLVHLHAAQLNGQRLDQMTALVEYLPIPIWTMDTSGHVLRKNAAYRALEEQLEGSSDVNVPLVRNGETATDRPVLTYRIMLDPRGRLPERWFDVSARRIEDGWQCSAQDVTALVRAELAQRNFVQTLTKTFAQLSTGLAIFDRDRQLILFNPSLVDLTSLSPEFLTSRPALSHFFDHLRDQRIMPEPKNYASWREQLNALVSAAADGRYQETWSLPSGATYRVTGRPHPNGVVAFLFEDISDEISMTRRFRQQLSLSQSVLDAITDPIVIFDAQGLMSYCNAAYRRLFHIDPDEDLSQVVIRDAHRTWCRKATTSTGLGELLERLLTRPDRQDWTHTLQLRDVGEVSCRVVPLVSGACMVNFGLMRVAALPVETAAE
ncbi:PAS domain-containing protein [Puniceibacterium sp. HSS470]|nr:PAS domain-containing protein [Puniceibacterium sp. HSS470]